MERRAQRACAPFTSKTDLTSQMIRDLREQVINVKRFGQKIICAGLASGLRCAGMGGEHNDGNRFRLLLALEIPDNLTPVFPGEQDIDQDKMGQPAVVQLFKVLTFV